MKVIKKLHSKSIYFFLPAAVTKLMEMKLR